MMRRTVRCLGWAAIASLMLASPAVVALGIPLAYGIGSDIVASGWRAPLALLGAAALALHAWRRGAPQTAAKSIS